MRFGKKRSRTTAGRETQKQIPTSAPTQVIVPNQQDVDSPLHLEEKNVDSPQDNVSQVAGDPIQQLFTTLGKFHRHLNKAQHAPQGTGWCDECMNELMEGLEISIAHQWPPIKDALIDTARILHSYEEAGKAGTCVPFLKNSYELLSLMVGDLIVDTVRAGVKQKWQEHYLHAVEELKSQGITLIEDKKEDIALTPPAPDINLSAEMTPQPIPPNKTISVEIDMQQDTSKQIEPPAETSPKPVADLDNMSFDLPPLSDNFTNKNTDKKSEELGDIVPFPSKNEKTPFEDAPQNDDIHEKDLLKLDGLETLKKETETAEETDDSIKNKDNFDADSPIPEKPKQPAETQEKEKVIEEEIKEEGATDTLESPKNTTVLKDADASNLLKSDPADNEKKTVVTEETSSTTSPAAPMLEGASPEALLQRVQAAISSGDTRNTKAMALELAVAMAQLEYEQARKDLATAEQLLLENVRVIQQNSAKVTQMENDLLRTEELRGARDGEYNSCHQQIGNLDGEMNTLSSELVNIDAQIISLQQKRIEQQNLIEKKRKEHQDAIDSEGSTQNELKALTRETETIQSHLEEARKEVQESNTKHRTIELDIVRTQEEMEVQRLSLATIENTLNPTDDSPEKDSESESLL